MQKYFAADTAENLIGHLESEMGLSFTSKNSTSSSNAGLSGMANMWDRNFRAYYSGNLDDIWNGGGVRFAGNEGELIKMSVNQARALIGEFGSLVSKQRLSFEAIAGKSDAKTFQSARLANAISDQLVKDEKLDIKADSMLEHSSVLGSGYIDLSWNPTAGRILSRNNMGIKYSGKLEYRELSVYDVFYDYMQTDFYNLDWLVVCWDENRWDLIAQYPQLEKEIRALPSIEPRFVFNSGRHDERVKVMKFIHRNSPAMPEGRLCVFASANAVFFDEVNPYGFIPVVSCTPNRILGTGIGYPLFTELLPLQEMIDSGFSTIASNQAAFGVQSILVPNNADINVHDIGGLNFIKYNMQQGGGEPKALQLTNTPPEIFKFIELLVSNQMQISKINSALRGSPPPGVTSGTAIATLTANALELVQHASKAYTISIETLMDYSFRVLRLFASEQQLVYMLGRNKQSIIREWKGSDLSNIYAVRLKTSNPLSKTAAGRITITEHMMELGLIKTPEHYQMVQETGNIDDVLDDTIDESIWILEENDLLREGKPVMAVKSEKHAQHYNTHKCLLFDPAVRNNPQTLQNVLAHLDGHEQLGKDTDPWILAVVETGQLPPPQPMGMPGMPPPGGEPPPEGGAMPGPEAGGEGIAEPAQPAIGNQGGLV